MQTIITWVKSFLLRRRIKKLFGFCEYEGCLRRSTTIVDFKIGGRVLATRDVCEEHKDIILK